MYWKVYVVNLTEQLAQVAVVGPNARRTLEKLGGMDVSKEALAFMEWKMALWAGLTRVYRFRFRESCLTRLRCQQDRDWHFGTPFSKPERIWCDPLWHRSAARHAGEKGFIMIGDERTGQ